MMMEMLLLGALLLLCALATLYFFMQWQQAKTQQQALSEQATLSVQQQHALQAQNTQFQQQLQQHAQRLVQSETQLAGREQLLAERDNTISQLQSELRASGLTHQQLQQQIQEQLQALTQFKTEAESSQSQLAMLRGDLQHKEQAYQTLLAQWQQDSQTLAELRTAMQEKQQHFDEQLSHFDTLKQQMGIEFQQLAQKVFEEKAKTFGETNQNAINTLLKPFKEKIETFEKRVNDVHSESLKNSASLSEQIKQMLETSLSMSKEAHDLSNALKGNNKVMGNWGEMHLELALQNADLIKGVEYQSQVALKSADGKDYQPDFIINLPDDKHIVIDSKVSLIAYERAINAENALEQQAALDAHCQSIRQHIDGLAKKNYHDLLGIHSPDFVLMFIPIESAYLEALKHAPNLFEEAYRKKVVLVSFTTLLPILRTVANLWRIERGNRSAAEILDYAAGLYDSVCTIVERLAKVGGSLETLTRNFNQVVTAVDGKQGIVPKLQKIDRLVTHKKTLNTLKSVEEQPSAQLELSIQRLAQAPKSEPLEAQTDSAE